MKKTILSNRSKAGMVMAAVGGLLTFTVALAPAGTRAVVLPSWPMLLCAGYAAQEAGTVGPAGSGPEHSSGLDHTGLRPDQAQCCRATTTYGQQRCGPAEGGLDQTRRCRGCVPNEIIIKFRRTAADTIEEQLALADSAACPHLSCDLDQLNARYAVREIKPLLKDFRRRQQQLKSLREKSYARPLVSAKARAVVGKAGMIRPGVAGSTQKEKDILRKLKRAPRGAKVPDLDRIYRIKLDCGCDPRRAGDQGRRCRLEEVLEAYRSNPDVEYAELNYIVSVNSTPNDPLYPVQWSANKMNAPEAWDIYTGSSQTIVAVVDTGADYNHRDLRDNIWVNEAELNGTEGVDDDKNGYVDDIYGYNFIYNSSDPIDDHGHGTMCSGIISAKGDNGLDITGVCWNTKIMALKILGSLGEGSISDAVLAIYYAVANGADVISNSWGAADESKSLKDAVDYAYSQGVIIVASAGNDDYSESPRYPAGYENVISVAATDSNDNKWSFSNYGDWVDIAAPGVDVLSLRAAGTSVGTSYDQYTAISSGTSIACPHIAGACALLLSANPLMTYDEVYDTLMRTADPIAPGICLSDGRVNLSKAMHAVVPSRGYINLDHDYYACGSVAGMLLVDWDLKGKSSQEATIMTGSGDLEKVVLTETTPAFGVFTGTISIGSGEPNTGDDTVQVSYGEVITAIYFDANDGTGNAAATMDSALMDCEVPTVLDVHVETRGHVARITFMTNEPTRAQIRCGPARGGPYTLVEEDTVMVTNHTVELRPLAINTDYYFVIDLVDAVGNETIADNDGLGYSFATPAEFLGFCVPGVYPSIQAAIDDASQGDTVWVADGTYTDEGNFDIDFKGKAITVRSENGPENCIIDCQRERRGFDFHNGEDKNSVLDGFTIANGFATESGGAAIRCTASSPTITNCIIVGNSAKDYGGGMYNSYNSNPTLINCTFSENSAESTVSMLGNGGGMCNMVNSSPTLTNCTFSGNSASYSGAGMYNYQGSSPTLIKCTFSANSAKHGGGMYNSYDSDPTLTNCTFSENSAEYGGAMKNYESAPTLINCTLTGNSAEMGGGIWNGRGSASKLTNCILWGNSEFEGMDESAQISDSHSIEASVANYCCIQGLTGSLEGIANIDSDPLFVDPNTGDYHLKSTGWRWDNKRQRWHYDKITSQCIDAGNPGSPLDGELLSMPGDPANKWGINLRINIGTYGGTAEASMPPYDWTLLGDLTNDGIVNTRDFAVQAQYWMRTENPPKAGIIEDSVAGQPGDLDRNGVVDTTDLALLIEDWLRYVKPPVVNIISPQNGAVFFMQPVAIEIEAEAWDINGSVIKVEFFVDERKIHEDYDGSDGWKADWREYARGPYSLTARATDSSEVTTTSAPVGIRIIPPP